MEWNQEENDRKLNNGKEEKGIVLGQENLSRKRERKKRESERKREKERRKEVKRSKSLTQRNFLLFRKFNPINFDERISGKEISFDSNVSREGESKKRKKTEKGRRRKSQKIREKRMFNHMSPERNS